MKFKIGDQEIEYDTDEELAYLQSLEIDTELDLDDNYCECALYTLGDHRCNCGNRRVYVELDRYKDVFFLRAEVY